MELDDLGELDDLRAPRRSWPTSSPPTTSRTSRPRWSPVRVAGVVVWENTWAAPFAAAARRAGGQLIASGRIPIQAIAASLEAEDAERRRLTCRLRPARAARRGVIGAPVARTAATVGTVAVVAHGVNRRTRPQEDRRDDRGPRR